MTDRQVEIDRDWKVYVGRKANICLVSMKE